MSERECECARAGRPLACGRCTIPKWLQKQPNTDAEDREGPPPCQGDVVKRSPYGSDV